jgi:hypothetical protein
VLPVSRAAHTGAIVVALAVSRASSIAGDRGRIGVDRLLRGDLGDPPGELDVLLGHPFDDVLGALVVPVDGVVADQLEIDVPVAHRHARVVTECVAGLAHRGDEPYAGTEVADQVAGMESLTELAPVGEVRLGDLVAREHVHGRTVIRIPDDRRPEPDLRSSPAPGRRVRQPAGSCSSVIHRG